MVNNQNIGVLSEKVARLESDVKTLALPSVTSSDAGKSPVVNSSGAWEAATIDGDNVKYSEGVSISDKIGDAVTALGKIDALALLLDQKEIPTTATAYNCNWQNYKYILFCTCRYDNITTSLLVPKTYFQTTSVGTKVITNDTTYNKSFSYYQNGNGSINVTASSLETDHGVKIYGIDEI